MFKKSKQIADSLLDMDSDSSDDATAEEAQLGTMNWKFFLNIFSMSNRASSNSTLYPKPVYPKGPTGPGPGPRA